MRFWALLVLAAVAFTGLTVGTGVVRHRRLRQRGSSSRVVLHPLSRHPDRRVPEPLRDRFVYHLGLFIGFLVVLWFGFFFARVVKAVVEQLF